MVANSVEHSVCTPEQLARARANGQAFSNTHPRAVLVHFDPIKEKVVIAFNDKTEFAFPPDLAQGLENASPEQLSKVEITPSGLGLHWESLDADLSIPDLMNGIYGTKKWMQALAQKGGQSKSSKKATAARENGKKGGRPSKAIAAPK
ncbi:hypothetical protein NIES30_25005 [Phormidium tenue NIES-30]|uniref:DUF2442 domain-containing protein n=1 Tax=Phormidium tenue NIES-30 TaxID=549789 RepID=A0A1U7IY37_9CYAN|nr:hypothetical protein NIES30_25005 [Phormidium tenue NIES-30]